MIKIIGDGGHAKVVRDVIVRMPVEYTGEDVAFVAVGNNAQRQSEVSRMDGCKFPVLIHPCAIVAAGVEIGGGTVIMANALVQPGVKIGCHCILNSGAQADHDCTIGDFAHIAPGAVLCGGVTVGEGALVGAGAVCVPGAVIPPWSLVKAGSVAK